MTRRLAVIMGEMVAGCCLATASTGCALATARPVVHCCRTRCDDNVAAACATQPRTLPPHPRPHPPTTTTCAPGRVLDRRQRPVVAQAPDTRVHVRDALGAGRGQRHHVLNVASGRAPVHARTHTCAGSTEERACLDAWWHHVAAMQAPLCRARRAPLRCVQRQSRVRRESPTDLDPHAELLYQLQGRRRRRVPAPRKVTQGGPVSPGGT